MPRPTPEQLKKWYASFVKKVSDSGFDLNTVDGRMRVKGLHSEPGGDKMDIDADYYAFAQSDGDGNYVNPIPMPENYNEMMVTMSSLPSERGDFKDELEKLTTKGKVNYSPNMDAKLDKLHKHVEEVASLSNDFFDDMEKAFRPYDEWLGHNLTPVNPGREEDLPRIEKFYNLALEGKLCLMTDSANAEKEQQIYVNANGECGLTKKFDDYPPVRVDAPIKQIFDNPLFIFCSIDTHNFIENPGIRAEYEKRYQVRLHDPATPEEEKDFQNRLLAKAYPDVPEEKRGDMADALFYGNMYQKTNKVRTEHSNREILEFFHLKDISDRTAKTPGYLETIASNPEKAEELRAGFKRESQDKIQAEVEQMQLQYERVANPIYEAKAEEELRLKAWYNSFAEEVKMLGGDLTNPADMMNVNIYFETKGKDATLTDRLAFVPMDGNGKYTDPEPILDGDKFSELHESLAQVAKPREQAQAEYEKAAALISQNRIEEAREASAMGDFYNDKADKTESDFLAEQAALQSKRDAWMVRNLKPIDPNNPADLDRIRTMYKQAQKGLLSYGQGTSAEDLRQVSVSDDGSCTIGIAMKDTPPDLNTTWDKLISDKYTVFSSADIKEIFDNNPEIRAKYEETFNEKIIDPVPVPERPADLVKPVKPPKPGAWSAVKWFFSFGRATGDYDAYSSYDAKLADYNTRMREFSQRELEATRANAGARMQWEKVCNNISKNRHPEAPDKAGMLDDNFYRMFGHRTQIGENTTQPETALPMMHAHMHKLWFAAKNDPEALSAKNIDNDGNFILPQGFTDYDRGTVISNRENATATFARKSMQAQITQEVSQMDLKFNISEVSNNPQLLGHVMEGLMAPCAIPPDQLQSSEQLVTSVESGNLGDLNTLDANSRIAPVISAFSDPADFEKGLATLTGMLCNADTDSFTKLVDYTLLSEKAPDRLNNKFPDQMKHLRNVSQEAVCNPDGSVNRTKYANALATVVKKCTASIFQKDGTGLTADRVAMSCLASKLAGKLDEMGRGDLIPDDTRKQLGIVKNIPFVVNVSTAGSPVMASLAAGDHIPEDVRRQFGTEAIQNYSRTMSAILLHGTIDSAFKSGDFAHLAMIKDTPSTLAAMKGFEKKIKAVKDPLDFTNLHDPAVRNRLANNVMSGKAVNGRSLDADEPAQIKGGPGMKH